LSAGVDNCADSITLNEQVTSDEHGAACGALVCCWKPETKQYNCGDICVARGFGSGLCSSVMETKCTKTLQMSFCECFI
jgi:hypothetical protein